MAQTKAHIKATIRYETKAYDKILLRLRKDGELTRDMVALAAQARGESVNEFIINAIRERMSDPPEEITREQFFD